MDWQFWKPRHTVESVARQLAAGLADGSVVLDEPLIDEPPDEDGDGLKGLVLQLDVPDNLSDAEVLELVKTLSLTVDEDHRRHGGQGLTIRQVDITRPAPAASDKAAVRVALRTKSDADRPEAMAAVAEDMRQKPDLRVITVPAELHPQT